MCSGWVGWFGDAPQRARGPRCICASRNYATMISSLGALAEDKTGGTELAATL